MDAVFFSFIKLIGMLSAYLFATYSIQISNQPNHAQIGTS